MLRACLEALALATKLQVSSSGRHRARNERQDQDAHPVARDNEAKRKYEQVAGSVIGPIPSDNHPAAFKSLFPNWKAWRFAVSLLNERKRRRVMRKFIAALALISLIAIPTLTQTANAAPVSPSSSSFGSNGY